MNGWLMAGALENTPARQWFVYWVMLLIVAGTLLRTAGNLSELRRLRRFGQRRAGYYAIRVWGPHQGRCKYFWWLNASL